MTIEEIMAALKAIVDSAEGRDLTPEEVERYEGLEGQLKAANKTAEIRSRQQAYQTPVPGSAIHVATPKADDTLERAFDHYLRTGQQNQDIVQLRAQSEGVGTEGGYLVPDGFRDKMVERMKAFGGVANVAETITTSTGNPLPWPTMDDTSNVGEIVAEGGTFAAGADLTFSNSSLSAYKYMAGGASSTPLRLSVELLQDAAFDVQGLVARKLGERIARIQATHLVSGTGVAQPKGIQAGVTGVGVSTSAAITYNDLVGFTHQVDPAYREGSVWIFNDTTMSVIEKIRDDSGGSGLGRPLFMNASEGMSTASGRPTLLGYPIVIDQAFSSTLNSASTNWGVFGNVQEGYVIRRVADITLIVNPWTRAANGQVEFTAWARMDATIQNSNAYIALAGKA